MVLVAVDDLLFSSKIRAAAGASGGTVAFVRSRAALVPEIRARRPALVIFDLDAAPLDPIGAIEEIRRTPDLTSVRLVGFVSHVHADRIAAARAAGIDTVMARSAFVAALPRLVGPDPGLPSQAP
jgi:DNA-binding NarL/FixJ family response regulator